MFREGFGPHSSPSIGFIPFREGGGVPIPFGARSGAENAPQVGEIDGESRILESHLQLLRVCMRVLGWFALAVPQFRWRRQTGRCRPG